MDLPDRWDMVDDPGFDSGLEPWVGVCLRNNRLRNETGLAGKCKIAGFGGTPVKKTGVNRKNEKTDPGGLNQSRDANKNHSLKDRPWLKPYSIFSAFLG